MTCETGKMGAKGFGQQMVDQTPRFERRVFSRKAKVYRPDKRKKKVKFL